MSTSERIGAVTASQGGSSLVSQWRALRKLYPIYVAMAGHLSLPPAPYPSLDELDERSSANATLQLMDWVRATDERVEPAGLRQFLQATDTGASEHKLQALISHILRKETKNENDRCKLDFLLVQYFSVCAPPSFQERWVTREQVAEVLEPILGECAADLPDWLAPLEELLELLRQSRTLREVQEHAIVRQGREIKLAAAQMYFEPRPLVAFTHYNYLLRRECVRLMDADLKGIGESLTTLEARGVQYADCSAAGFSEHETLEELKQRWSSWEIPADLEYSKNDLFGPLLELRDCLQAALTPRPERVEAAAGDEVGHLRAELAGLKRSMENLPAEIAKMVSAAVERAFLDHGHLFREPAPVDSHAARVVAAAAFFSAPADSQTKKVAQLPAASPIDAAPKEQAPEPMTDPVPSPKTAVLHIPVEPEMAEAELAAETAPAPDVSASAEPESQPATPEPAERERITTAMPAVTLPPVEAPASVAPAASVPVVPAAPAPAVQPAAAASAAKQVVPAQESPAAKETPAAKEVLAAPAVRREQPAFDALGGDVKLMDATRESVTECVGRLKKVLGSTVKRKSSAVSLAINNVRVLLTPPEVFTLLERNDPAAQSLQHAVALRLLLVNSLENQKQSKDQGNLASLVKLARSEYEDLQAQMGKCHEAKQLEDEEALNHTGKQLLSVLERAEKLVKK